MIKNIFKAIDSDFINHYLENKKNVFFPEKKEVEIKEVEIKQISPVWAKETCLTRYEIKFRDNSKKIIRGTSKSESSKENIWNIMKYLYEYIPIEKKLAIPRPLDYLKEINLLLYEEAPGIPLVSILGKNNEKIKETSLKKAAAWLSWIHDLTIDDKKIPKAVFIKSNGYEKTFSKIEKFIPELKKHLPIEKNVDFIDKAWDFKKTIIHNDFYPGNSIVGKNCFFGIDFDRSGLGPPLMDVAALFSFFDFSKRMWPSKMDKKESRKLKNIFLKEYCSIRNLSFKETNEKIHPFLIKSFLDQLHYYVNFLLRGRRFMDKKTEMSFVAIIKGILIKIEKLQRKK